MLGKTPDKGKRSARSSSSAFRCDPDQIQGLNVAAESSCLVLLGLYPQVNISERDSQGQTSWMTGVKAIIFALSCAVAPQVKGQDPLASVYAQRVSEHAHVVHPQVASRKPTSSLQHT